MESCACGEGGVKGRAGKEGMGVENVAPALVGLLSPDAMTVA